MNKAVFCDRDGTITVDKHYVYQIKDFEFLPGVPQALSELRKMGYLLILVTNQSGVARGYYTVEQMHALHRYMQGELQKYQAQFDEILFCPHYPKGMILKYAVDCRCRKPRDLLFLKAIEKYGIVPELSIAVGDKDRDLIPAQQLGMRCIRISREKSSDWIVCHTWEDVMRHIKIHYAE